MGELPGQMDIFELLQRPEPGKDWEPEPGRLINGRDFLPGVKGWMLHAVYCPVGKPFREEAIITYTDRWVSVREPKWEKSSSGERWNAACERVYGPYGYMGGYMPKLWHTTPTFTEREAYAMQSQDYRPGMRIVDADTVCALTGEPLSEEEKAKIRGIWPQKRR